MFSNGRVDMRAFLGILLGFSLACGGGGGSSSGPTPPGDPWAPVTAAIQSAQSQFPAGLCVEVLSPAGVVYSRSFGAFTNTSYVPVASASKIVSATVLLRLVDQGAFNLGLDTQAKSLLIARNSQAWSGPMGDIRLRELLSFTSGINGDVLASESDSITLEEAVLRIYEDQASTASAPGSYFYYGSTHLRIAARMAEVATGKTWRQIFSEQLRLPLGWDVLSTYGNGTNPNPAGSLACTGVEYTRFLMLQLRKGLDGSTRLLPQSGIDQQRLDGFQATTPITYSPFSALLGRSYHYGFGNWLETANGQAPSPTNPVNRWSSTGKFGWAPWIESDSSYAALIMTQQADAPASFVPSENLKAQLNPLIRAALASNPPVIRTVP